MTPIQWYSLKLPNSPNLGSNLVPLSLSGWKWRNNEKWWSVLLLVRMAQNKIKLFSSQLDFIGCFFFLPCMPCLYRSRNFRWLLISTFAIIQKKKEREFYSDESQQKQYVLIGLLLVWPEISFSCCLLNMEPWTNYSSSLCTYFPILRMRLTSWLLSSLLSLKFCGSNYNAHHIVLVIRSKLGYSLYLPK